MNIKCNYTTNQYKEKPKGNYGKVQDELSEPQEIDIKKLANLIGNGSNFRAAAIKRYYPKGSQDAKIDFISQQLFALDFDNKPAKNQKVEFFKITLEEILERLKQNNLDYNFIYETWSSSEDLKKYRVVFVTDRPITDQHERNLIQDYLFSLFIHNTDTQCKDSSRIFYGTNKGVLQSNYDAVIKSSEILKMHPQVEWLEAEETKRPKTKKEKIANPKEPASKDGISNIDAIIKHDADYLKEKLKSKPKTFNNKAEYNDYIYKEINLAELLEVPHKKSFHCIFHEDSTPSASVFKSSTGVWLYKCHAGCCENLNTKRVIEKLGNFTSEYKVKEFISSIYNLSINKTEWYCEQIENLDEIIHSIQSDEEVLNDI